MCDGTAPVPIPQSLVGALFRILFEVPLRNAREASVDFKDKFCTSKNVAKSCGRYELMGVVMGFGKGETSLTDLIRIPALLGKAVEEQSTADNSSKRSIMFEDSQVDPEESVSTFSSELNSGENGKERQN